MHLAAFRRTCWIRYKVSQHSRFSTWLQTSDDVLQPGCRSPDAAQRNPRKLCDGPTHILRLTETPHPQQPADYRIFSADSTEQIGLFPDPHRAGENVRPAPRPGEFSPGRAKAVKLGRFSTKLCRRGYCPWLSSLTTFEWQMWCAERCALVPGVGAAD